MQGGRTVGGFRKEFFETLLKLFTCWTLAKACPALGSLFLSGWTASASCLKATLISSSVELISTPSTWHHNISFWHIIENLPHNEIWPEALFKLD